MSLHPDAAAQSQAQPSADAPKKTTLVLSSLPPKQHGFGNQQVSFQAILSRAVRGNSASARLSRAA